MLSRQGHVVIGAAVAALVVGRLFAVIELYVVAAALAIAIAFALGYVTVRRPQVRASRWVHPALLAAGDTGRVDIQLVHDGSVRSAPFTLCENVRRTRDDEREARLDVAPMRGRSTSSTGYRLPTAIRGVVQLGPLAVELRDPLGIACSRRGVAGVDEVVVAPRAALLDMPHLGQGLLGATLLDRARRLGPGDFHGLRDYAIGDEPRTIHWRASARTDTLVVRQHTVEGLHRCTVVFDTARSSYTGSGGFERAVTIAASLVTSSVRAGLTTRFVGSHGVDLRGPEVAAHTMRVLARIEPDDGDLPALARDPADGLGLVVVVSGRSSGPAWRAARVVADPTATFVEVVTDATTGDGAGRSRLTVAGGTDDELVGRWQSMVGRG